MGKRTHYQPGTFSWVELAAPDPEAAVAFYAAIFGWEGNDLASSEAGTYVLLQLGGDSVAGLYRLSDDQQAGGVTPSWLSYVTVESADVVSAQAGDLGGTVLTAPFDVRDSVRTAVIQDPTGAALGLWEPRGDIGATRVNDPGCLSWNDLVTPEPAVAERFYSDLFGWEVRELEGADGYRIVQNAGASNGGMMPSSMVGDAPPHWLPYFNGGEMEKAVAKVGEAGGRVIAGPRQVPAGRFAVAQDPQGATFAFFEGDFDE